MPQLLTPARLTALVGSLTGLGTIITALLNAIPHESGLGRGLQAAGGALGTAVILGKFLEGQAGWEQQQSANAHEVKHFPRVEDVKPSIADYAPLTAGWFPETPDVSFSPDVGKEIR